MQVTPPQMPVASTPLSQESVVKAIPQVQAQATAPLTQRAIDPSPKSKGENRTRNNRDRGQGGDKPMDDPSGGPSSGRGDSVNIRV